MHFMLTAIAALVGAVVFEALKVPAGSLIGAAVAVIAVNMSPLTAAGVPRVVQFVSFAAVGWLIGEGVTRDVVRSLATSAPLVGVTVVLLLAFGGALAFVFVRLNLVDPATAFLATSPGGLSQMTVLSAAVGADASLVATLHMVRVIAVIVLAPVVLRILPSSG